MRSICFGDTTIDRCEACAGLWLDALEKNKLLSGKSNIKYADIALPGSAQSAEPPTPSSDSGLDTLTEPPAPAKRTEPLTCPRDRSKMIQMVDHHQPHVHYESCTICGGVFLDSGELRDLSQRTFGERLRALFRKR